MNGLPVSLSPISSKRLQKEEIKGNNTYHNKPDAAYRTAKRKTHDVTHDSPRHDTTRYDTAPPKEAQRATRHGEYTSSDATIHQKPGHEETRLHMVPIQRRRTKAVLPAGRWDARQDRHPKTRKHSPQSKNTTRLTSKARGLPTPVCRLTRSTTFAPGYCIAGPVDPVMHRAPPTNNRPVTEISLHRVLAREA